MPLDAGGRGQGAGAQRAQQGARPGCAFDAVTITIVLKSHFRDSQGLCHETRREPYNVTKESSFSNMLGLEVITHSPTKTKHFVKEKEK